MTCGNGKQISTRKIIQQALNGGLECEGDETKTKPCKLKKCKGNLIQMKNILHCEFIQKLVENQ